MTFLCISNGKRTTCFSMGLQINVFRWDYQVRRQFNTIQPKRNSHTLSVNETKNYTCEVIKHTAIAACILKFLNQHWNNFQIFKHNSYNILHFFKLRSKMHMRTLNRNISSTITQTFVLKHRHRRKTHRHFPPTRLCTCCTF